MRRLGMLLACVGILVVPLGVAVGVSPPAYAAEVGYTDGTQCMGTLCPGVPPPTDPVFAQGEECKTDIIDPAGFVFVTEHFVYGTTPPPAGVVPVVADAHGVFPYHGVAPALFPIDIEAFVAGKQGFRADTWNIGMGVTAWVPFDCRPPVTTTTSTTTVAPTTTTSSTISGETSTTSSSTTTSIGNLGSTTTSVEPLGSTTSIGNLGSSSTTVAAASPSSLPFTGGGSGMIPIALTTLGAGVALVFGAKRRRALRGRP
jgi:hypothetical protein